MVYWRKYNEVTEISATSVFFPLSHDAGALKALFVPSYG